MRKEEGGKRKGGGRKVKGKSGVSTCGVDGYLRVT
jgi:hypothetical protein